MTDPKFPAAFTMQWAGQPVHVCARHGRALMNVARAMGGGLSFGGQLLPPEAPQGAECSNCVNEAEASSAATCGVAETARETKAGEPPMNQEKAT